MAELARSDPQSDVGSSREWRVGQHAAVAVAIRAVSEDGGDDGSHLLESVVFEVQGPAILGHVSHELVRCPIRQMGLYFECDLNLGTDDLCQVLENFLGGRS